MELSAVVSRDELAALVRSVSPLRLAIDERRGRAATLVASDVELVPSRGLRVRGSARVTWDVAGVPLTITLKTWRAMLVPRVAQGRALVLEPVLEDLDLKNVPAFLDDKIGDAIRDAIAQNKGKLAWGFARALTKKWPMPLRSSLAAFGLEVVSGTVLVDANEVRLSVRFEARFERRVARVREAVVTATR
jgi:hypothetical protein